MLDQMPSQNCTSQNCKCDDLLPLSARGLGFERAGQALLQDLNFTISCTGITLIMGPNGAGKSVLIRLLHGLEEPSSGHIEWGTMPIGQSLQQRQAMVFQKPVLLRRSTAANMDFALRLKGPVDHRRRADLLHAVGLAGMEQTPARSLSGGEQQRLALARALATSPDVLILDEPTANLDPASTKIIEDIVRAEKQAGTKVIFVTHDTGQAQRLGDEVLFLHRGRLVEHTPAEEFFQSPRSAAARDYIAGRLVL